MGVIDSLRTYLGLERNAVIPPRLPLIDNLWPFVNIGGSIYPMGLNQTISAKREEIDGSFAGYAGAFKTNAVVFATLMKRVLIFSEARFQFQAMTGGRPGDLFGTPSLGILEHPWGPRSTTGDLLATMELYNSLGGNAYVTRRPGNMLRVLRPDWVVIVSGSNNDPDVEMWDLEAELLGYVYYPGGPGSGREPKALLADQVAHYRPIPDPLSPHRGQSWLQAAVRDILGDNAATSHKLAFFEHAGTPNMVVKRSDSLAKDAFKTWVEMMESGHAGVANAYKTLYLDSGSDATVVGADLKQLEFKATQGAGETRIAAASGIHPSVIGLSEGMQGSSLNAGNLAELKRLTADTTLRPLWRNAAGSLEILVPPPAGSRLWYDDRDISFLRIDRKDAATIQQTKAATIRQLVDGGYTPDSVTKAVEAEDMGLLKHTGLFSVQLQPPGTTEPTPVTEPTNGKGPKVKMP